MKCQNAGAAITLMVQTDSSANNGAGLNKLGLGTGEQKGLLAMENNFLVVGQYVCIFGGLLLALILSGLLAYLLVSVWVSFSNKFRDVCKAESLIFEYRKEKDEYLKWKKERKNNG